MTTLDKKRKNAELFIKQLINFSPTDISQVFLFGSVAQGNPSQESDIDLMIFSKRPKKVLNKIKDTVFDFLLEKNEIIEPQVYSEKDYQNPPSYFIWQTIKKGERIY